MKLRSTVGAVLVLAAVALAGPASASQSLPSLLTDQASTATPAVPGGDCYPGVLDPSACRRVLSMLQVGNWIYVGGIISDVYDPSSGQTVSGFHNLFRFNATTHALDPTWQPQAYRTLTTYRDAGVSGLAVSPDGSTLYAAGGFTYVSGGPGQTAYARRGIAAFTTATGAVQTGFNAKIGQGGGPSVGNDVQYVGNTLWFGGLFTHLAGQAKTALASLDPATGALTSNVSETLAGVVTTTVGTKVKNIAINPQHTLAAVIGNFATVDGVTHKEVVLLNVDTNGGSTSASTWNAPTYLNASQTNCKASDTWARGVDWNPAGTYFDIAASGGGGFDAFPGLCDAFSRFAASSNSNATPAIVNYTGYDSLFTVCDTGNYVYTGGHNKYLDHAVYINGVKVTSKEQTHYGLGVIDVNPNDTNYGHAVTSWNNTTATGRGAGWASCLVAGGGASVGGGLYMGGDAQQVNGNPNIKRLAYFPG